jgi:hypothetical protein
MLNKLLAKIYLYVLDFFNPIDLDLKIVFAIILFVIIGCLIYINS